MMKFFYIFSLQTIVASAQKVGNHMGGNNTDMFDEPSYLRSLRRNGNKQGKGRNGGMKNGGRAGGRSDMMDIIHKLFDNRGSIMREITETPDGVTTYTHSDDDQVANWIITHVKQMTSLMEAEKGIRLWDDLFEKAFEYHNLNHLTFSEVEDGVTVTHEVNHDVEGQARDCLVAIIHEHSSVVSDFIQRGSDEAQANHAVPDICSGM
eukprot:CCRYP_014601-RA/>CCRYP_014601-RA protein AED:0.00 eAED:0.00 QI:439/1/1/1/1/1/2/142/206